MAANRKKIRVGDILELKVGNTYAYLHYMGKHREYGDVIMVGLRSQERQTKLTSKIFSNGYVAFYPAAIAVAQGMVEIVGNLQAPNIPKQLRRAGVRSGHRVITWIIENESEEIVKSELSEENLQLPIAGIWNHELLLQRVSEGWRPAHEA